MTADETLDRLREIRRQMALLQREQEALISGKDTRRAPSKTLSESQIDAAFAGLKTGGKNHERIATQ